MHADNSGMRACRRTYRVFSNYSRDAPALREMIRLRCTSFGIRSIKPQTFRELVEYLSSQGSEIEEVGMTRTKNTYSVRLGILMMEHEELLVVNYSEEPCKEPLITQQTEMSPITRI